MNHADRERLSQLLATLSVEIGHANPKVYTPDHKEMTRLIDEARAIVDTPDTLPPAGAPAWLRSTVLEPDTAAVEEQQWEKFVSHHDPAAHQPRLTPLGPPRHRARGKLAIVFALTAASVILVALTAASTPHIAPTHQPTPQNRPTDQPGPKQSMFWPTP